MCEEKLFKFYSCILSSASKGVVDSLRKAPYRKQSSFFFFLTWIKFRFFCVNLILDHFYNTPVIFIIIYSHWKLHSYTCKILVLSETFCLMLFFKKKRYFLLQLTYLDSLVAFRLVNELLASLEALLSNHSALPSHSLFTNFRIQFSPSSVLASNSWAK